jgi:hypothetical protein
MSSPELQQARELLIQAEVRIFLGFGCIEENVRRLRPAEWLTGRTEAPSGTTLHMKPGEIRRVQRLFPTSHSLRELPGACEEGLRDCVDRITRE